MSGDEVSFEELEQIVVHYLRSNVFIQLSDSEKPSTQWETSFAQFLRQHYGDFEKVGQNPDFGLPFNFDLKMVYGNRPKDATTFSFSGLTQEQADTGILPYRTVVLLWRINRDENRGYLYDGVVIPKDAKSVLPSWSYTGIQVKSSLSKDMCRHETLLQKHGATPWISNSLATPVISNSQEERLESMAQAPSGLVPTTGLKSSEPIKFETLSQTISDTSVPICASISLSETIQRRRLQNKMKIPRKLAPLADVTGELGRYNFQCVHVEKEADRALAVATDGKSLVAVSWPTTEEIVTRDVEGAAFKTEAKVAATKKEESFELPPATAREAAFPPFRTICKDVPAVGMRIELDALITALEALKSLAKGKGRAPLEVDLYAPQTAGNLIELRVEKDDIRAMASIATVPIATPHPQVFEKAKPAECVSSPA